MTPNPMKNQAFHRQNPQGGNVMFVILIGILLFAALSYAMSQNMRGNANMVTGEKARIAAQEIITYGGQLRNAVKDLIISNGCTDTQITFEGATYYTSMPNNAGYVNASAPTSNKCHVFDAAGGAMRAVTPVSDVNLNSFITFDGQHCYEGHGTGTSPCPNTAKELVFNVVDIPLSLCIEINKIAGIGTAGANPPTENFNYSTTTGSGPFRGIYETTDSAATIISGIGASGKNFGCYTDNSGDFDTKHIFFYILSAR